MANFVISSLVGNINSKRNSVLNTFKKNPFYEFFDDDKVWKKDKISARLNDLTIQKSAYNEVIPNVYGTARLAGNIIWATDIKEVKKEYTTTYSTGKGGKKVSQNNIEYPFDFIIKDEEGKPKVNKQGIPLIDKKYQKDFDKELTELLQTEIEINLYTIEEDAFNYEDNERYDALSPQDIYNLQMILCKTKESKED